MGGQKGIALFYRYLSALLPVTVVSTRNNDLPADLPAGFLPVLGNARLRYINPFLVFTFRKILRKKQSTHFIIEHPYFGWLGILLKGNSGSKLVVHSHNIESLRFKSNGKWWWRILWQYEKYTHRKADINFFITDEDRQYAVSNYKIDPAKCHTITYGTEMSSFPSMEEKAMARKKIAELHNIDAGEKILFFNGTLNYKPNLDAVDIILKNIHPILKKEKNFHYKIIICGKDLPGNYKNLQEWSGENIIYTGFVEDITIYFKAADIFINPVTDGGGIKTKLVEALGYNVNAVSTVSGAIGIPAAAGGKKLSVVTDGDWQAFTNAIVQADLSVDIQPVFFDHFYWGNIAKKAAAVIKG